METDGRRRSTMLDLFGKSNGQIDRGTDTYDLDETLSVSVKKAKKRQSMLIILCGEIVENYDTFLNKFAMNLYNLGYVDEPKAECRELLPMISSGNPMESIIREIKDICNRDKKVLFLNGFHQYEYSKANTSQLLNRLQQILFNNQIDVPLILNIPMVVKQELMALYPELWRYSIRYLNRNSQKYSNRDRVSSYGYTQEYSKTESDIRRPVNANITTKASDSSSVDLRQGESENRPWYTKELELLKQEKDGMVMLLKNSNSQFEIAALPKSKRLNWYFKLAMAANGVEYNLYLRIVYSEMFSKTNPAVGLVVENATEKLSRVISKNRRCEKVITTDPEFEKIFIIRPIKERNNDSVAAATLAGFIDLINSIKRYEII